MVNEYPYTKVPIVVSRVGISHFDLKIVSVRQYPYTKVPIVVSHVGISLLINDYGAKQYPYTSGETACVQQKLVSTFP